MTDTEQKDIDIRVSPKQAADEKSISSVVAKQLSVLEDEITAIRILRRSIDAR